MTDVKSTDHWMPGMAARERERRRSGHGESDSEKHYDSQQFHENYHLVLAIVVYDVLFDAMFTPNLE
jgi:hypothetical protein